MTWTMGEKHKTERTKSDGETRLNEPRGRQKVNRENKRRRFDLQKEGENRAQQENAIGMQNLREDREDNEELLRAVNALDHAKMIPMETEKERSYRESVLAERQRAGVPGTHRAACKAIVSEHRFTIHYCGEINLICQE